VLRAGRGCYDTGHCHAVKQTEHGSLLNDIQPNPQLGPTIIPRSEHNISRANISENALKVLYRLKNAGFAAFLVGGSVRDLLLDLHPKDFDVATDAHPEQIRELFRNCRLIGRRFRLAHVRFGREIIEVATFRAGVVDTDDDERSHSEAGRILRDNVYGSIEEDAWRRDFTVNALYYNIADYSVWDYTSGIADVRARKLRPIGEPATRFREDPVRMLRALRFAAKLDFEIDERSSALMGELGELLRDVPPARLFEEALKLFQYGHAVESFELLRRYDLFRYLFPATDALLSGEHAERVRDFTLRGLASTDERIADGKPVTPMFLFAVLLWPAIEELAERLQQEQNIGEHDAISEAAQSIVAAQQAWISLPKRFTLPMREILLMQRRFENRRGARAARLLQHTRFRAAYDFLLLRAEAGDVDPELCTWWTEVQQLPPPEQRQAFGIKRRRGSKGGRRRKRGRSAEAENGAS
jgi:poly(A) polymerase